MNPTRTVLGSGAILALLVAPPILLTRHGWPVGEEVTWDYLWLSLMSATLPPTVPHALVIALLWGLWGAFAVLVAVDLLALLRGQIPRVGLLRLAVTGIAGSSVAVSAPAVAAVAPAESAPTASAPDADSQEPAHVLQRTRTLPGFAFDSAELSPAMKDELLPTVELLQLFGDPEGEIVITGHTDATGPDGHNRKLSQRRADTVAVLLTAQLGDTWAVTTEGLGSDDPRGHPGLGPAADRRAEITYTLTTGPAVPAEPAQEDSADDTVDTRPTVDSHDADRFRAGAVLAGAAAGGVVGAVAGRLTAPGRRREKKEEGRSDEDESPDPLDSDAFDLREALGNPVPVTRDTDPAVVSAQGHVRIADSLSVSAREGLVLTGTHAAGACASLITRTLAAHPRTRLVTTRQIMDVAGAPPRARLAGMTVSADTAAAITEAELANITAARAEGGPVWVLLIVEAPEHALVSDRLHTLAQAEEDNDVLVLILGEGSGSPQVHCAAFERVDITAADGTTATYADLRLLHLDPGAFATHFTTDVEEPREGEPTSEEPEPEPEEIPASTEAATRAKVSIQLFAAHPHITVAGADIGTRMRSSTRRLLAYLALHPHGVGTDALTDTLFPDSTESKARGLRNTASSDARRVIRDALGDDSAEILSATSGRYQIRHDMVDVDVWRCDAALKAASTTRDADERLTHLRSAAAEYSQELLSEEDLAWIEEKRQAYRRAAADCFVSLAKATEHPEQALASLERARESDDLNEAVYQEIMKTHAALGRPDAVQRTYQDLTDRLKVMRARPSTATNKLLSSLSTAD